MKNIFTNLSWCTDYLRIVSEKKFILIYILALLLVGHLAVFIEIAPKWQTKTILLICWALFILPTAISVIVTEAIWIVAPKESKVLAIPKHKIIIFWGALSLASGLYLLVI